jgi:uncharacterized protein (TIGR02996 family)
MIHELLALWQETRSAEVTSLIEQVSAAHPRPPITGASQRALHAAWIEVAHADDPLDIDRLVAALAQGNLVQAGQRMRHLARRPPDPRVAAGLEHLLANPPSAAFVKGTSIDLWNEVFAELARIADPRTRTIHERLAWVAYDRATSPFDVGNLRWRTASGVARAAKSIPEPPELTAGQQQRIAELAARVRAIPKPIDRGAELLARIYEDPRDLDARAVYADWLTAQGDPRGEFIALQLARPLPQVRPWRFSEQDRTHRPTTREKQLWRTHKKAWMGRFGALLRFVAFEHGFPAWGHLASSVDVATIAVPEAATLEYLSINRDDFASGRRLASRPFHGLTAVGNLGWQTLAGLVAEPGTTVRAVEITYGELAGDFGFLDRDVHLDELALDLGHMASPPPATPNVRAFMRTRLVQQLRTLAVGWHVGNETAFVDAFVSSSIERLQFTSFGYATQVTIERAGGALRLVVDGHDPTLAARCDAIAARLRELT